MTTKKKEELLAQQQAEEEQKKNGTKPAEPSEVQKAQDELEIARAKVQAEAIRAGYPMPDPIEAWHIDIEQQKKRIDDDRKANILEAEKLRVAGEKLKSESESLAKAIEDNNNREKELSSGIAEINAGKVKIQEIFQEAQRTAQSDLNNFRQRVGGKTIGNIEDAIRILSTVKSSLVKRASLSFSCADCRKENATAPERQATWEIPTLDFLTSVKNASYDAERDEWKLGDGFGCCGDCEQIEDRQMPVGICDICPIQKLVVQAIDKIAVGLTLSGVSVRWDADGMYIPHMSIKEQGDMPTKEWVKKILIDTNLSDIDIEQKTTAAIGKLAEEEPLVEPVGIEGDESGDEEGEEE